jgi:hypothetical protein
MENTHEYEQSTSSTSTETPIVEVDVTIKTTTNTDTSTNADDHEIQDAVDELLNAVTTTNDSSLDSSSSSSSVDLATKDDSAVVTTAGASSADSSSSSSSSSSSTSDDSSSAADISVSTTTKSTQDDDIEDIERVDTSESSRAAYESRYYEHGQELTEEDVARELFRSMGPDEIIKAMQASGASQDELMMAMEYASMASQVNAMTSIGSNAPTIRSQGSQDDEEDEDKADEDLTFFQWLRSSLPTVNARKVKFWSRYAAIKCGRLVWMVSTAGILTAVPYVLMSISEQSFIETSKLTMELDQYKSGRVGPQAGANQVEGHRAPSGDLFSGIPAQ